MKYLKVFVDFAESLEPLGDAEIGRLFLAMLEYASNGTVPDFRGNERFVWPIAKRNIDASVKAYENLAANAKMARESLSKARASYNYDGLRIDKDKEKDKEKDNISPPISPPSGETQHRFVPPTVDEVREYCEERENGIDPCAFINHYTANGWMRGKTKIKDWKACVRTWEVKRKNDGLKNGESEKTKPKYLNPL